MARSVSSRSGPRAAPKPPLEVLVDQSNPVEQSDAGIQPGLAQDLVDIAVRGVQPQRVLVVAVVSTK